MLFKIGVLKNFVVVHRKTSVLEPLFNEVADPKATENNSLNKQWRAITDRAKSGSGLAPDLFCK